MTSRWYSRIGHIKGIMNDPIHIEECKNVNRKVIKGGNHEPPHYLDWAATRPNQPPPEPTP